MPGVEVFRCEPLLVPKVWGGRRLASVFGKTLPAEGPFGESWEVADLPEGQSLVGSGAMQGDSLGAAVARFGAALIGTAAPGGRFPLLVKLLDACADLSVQVHPGPRDLDTLGAAQSKDEAWLILHADSDGAIVHGLQQLTSMDDFRAAVADGALMPLLQRIPVSPGDVFRVPPGTIHAIGAGVALLEIQQPSDTTFRVYDYERPGLDGNPRPLHLEQALQVAHLGPTLPEERGLDRSTGPLAPAARVLANVDAYRIEQLAPTGPLSWPISAHSPQVVHVLRGSLCLDDVLLGPSETAIVPAGLGRVWLTKPENTEIVVAGLGGLPLIAAGG